MWATPIDLSNTFAAIPNLPKWKGLTSYVLVMVMLVVLSALKKKKSRINQENLSKGIPIEINYDLISLKWLSFLFLSFFFSCLAGAFHTSFNAVCKKEFIGGNGTKSLHLGGE